MVLVISLKVAECILEGGPFVEHSGLRSHVFANPRNTTYNDLKGDHQIATTVNTLNMHRAKTLHLGEEEPAGLTMLGIIVVRLADILSQELSTMHNSK